MRNAKALLRAAAMVAAVAVVCVLSAGGLLLFDGNAQWPVIGQGLVFGCLNAFFAVGLVLIYRATRIINFAHAGIGYLATALFFEFLTYTRLPFWLALPAAVLVAGGLGALIELLFIRRFFRAPRLVIAI